MVADGQERDSQRVPRGAIYHGINGNAAGASENMVHRANIDR